MVNFPTSLDVFSNPTGTDLLENATAALDHDVQHSNANDAIEALEAKVGANSSAVTTSHDYKLSAVTGSEKALTSGTSTQSVTNLTLVTPTLTLTSDATGDMYYRNSGGALTRLPIGSSGQIIQVSSGGEPEWIANPAATDASTTVKGVSEEATLAETLARTTTGGTSARLFVNPSTLTTVQTYDYVADTGSATAYAIAPTPAITAYVTGQKFTFKATNTNTTSTPTLAVSGLTAKTIVNQNGSILLVGQIVANGIYECVYDGTNMQIVSTSSDVSINDYVNNIPGTRTAYTYTMFPIDGSNGWTSPSGTFASTPALIYTDSGTTGQSIRAALLGQNGTSSAGRAWDSGIDTKISYIMQNDKASVGTTPFDGSDVWYFHGFCNGSSVSTLADITATAETRIGFAHYNAKIYALTCDGAAVTSTEVSASDTLKTRRHFIVDWTATSCKFYLNGVLVATHTTNIPSSSTNTAIFFGSADNASGSPFFGITPITVTETLS